MEGGDASRKPSGLSGEIYNSPNRETSERRLAPCAQFGYQRAIIWQKELICEIRTRALEDSMQRVHLGHLEALKTWRRVLERRIDAAALTRQGERDVRYKAVSVQSEESHRAAREIAGHARSAAASAAAALAISVQVYVPPNIVVSPSKVASPDAVIPSQTCVPRAAVASS